jgi:hypothetical protein
MEKAKFSETKIILILKDVLLRELTRERVKKKN